MLWLVDQLSRNPSVSLFDSVSKVFLEKTLFVLENSNDIIIIILSKVTVLDAVHLLQVSKQVQG